MVFWRNLWHLNREHVSQSTLRVFNPILQNQEGGNKKGCTKAKVEKI